QKPLLAIGLSHPEFVAQQAKILQGIHAMYFQPQVFSDYGLDGSLQHLRAFLFSDFLGGAVEEGNGSSQVGCDEPAADATDDPLIEFFKVFDRVYLLFQLLLDGEKAHGKIRAQESHSKEPEGVKRDPEGQGLPLYSGRVERD